MLKTIFLNKKLKFFILKMKKLTYNKKLKILKIYYRILKAKVKANKKRYKISTINCMKVCK